MVTAASGSAEVRAALEAAEQVAREHGAPEVAPEHVLLALAQGRPGHLAAIFERHKLTADDLRKALPGPAGKNGDGGSAPKGPLPPAPEIASAVARAARAASALGRGSFDASDLLLSLVQDRASKTTELLGKRFGLTGEKLIEDLRALRGQERAIQKAEGDDACAHHAGAPGNAARAGLDEAPGGGVGLAAELRDLEARHRALCENVNALRATEEALIPVVRRLWLAVIALTAALGYLFYLLRLR